MATWLWWSCAPERKNIFSNSYHNTTAHYNAYFIAKERIKEIEAVVEDRYEWNYNLILPVFPPFDSAVAQSYATQVEDCIEKASFSIQRHPGSNWEFDAYILVGKARFYSLDFANAVETFKYVNTKSDKDPARHEALINLMRTFVENHELNNAIAVSDYLKKEKLSKTDLKNLYLMRGYLYQRRQDYDNMVQNLSQAQPLITNAREKSRINFIIGQVYQQLGFDGEAYNYYKNTLRSNPPYELLFYTRLNMAQVTQLAKNSDAKKIRKYFKKLLKDRKNKEFQDKIYYEMGNFETRHGYLDLGIEYYNNSVRSSVNNKRQKAYSYWSLGRIYYDSLANYKLAKAYYDSTLAEMPKDEIEYQAIEARQKILENFVKQLTIIHTNDSLLDVASLSPDSLNSFLNQYIAQKEAEEVENRKKRRRDERVRAATSAASAFDSGGEPGIGTNNYEGSVWYFYNTSAVDRGRSEFRRIWGDRALESNWRRSNKASQSPLTAELPDVEKESTQSDKTKPSKEEAFKIDRDALIANLPKTDAEKQKLLDEIEEASYQLGKIYNFDLDEEHNAAETFETTINRFPETEYRYEIMYFLYLLFSDLGDAQKSEYYKNLILSEAPNSIYAKIIINPNYTEDSQAASAKMKVQYAEAYKLYREDRYKKSLDIINDAMRTYPENDFVDNMDLLRILVLGKSESVYKYQYELRNFSKTYSESELVPYVDSLVTASEQFQINLVNSTKAQFIPIFDRAHYFVFAYSTDPSLSNLLPEYFSDLIGERDSLKVGNLLLDASYSMILISEFDTKQKAEIFNKLMESENPAEKINKTGKFYNFVITKDNFNILYQTKELDAYLKFYRRNY